jgi:DHA1 family multidrug resistance protein-like MFS transporter
MDLIREAPFGQLVRYATGNRFFQYPEEKPGYKCPHSYSDPSTLEKKGSHKHHHNAANTSQAPSHPEEPPAELDERVDSEQTEAVSGLPTDKEKGDESSDASSHLDLDRVHTSASHLTRQETLPYTAERLRSDQAMELEKTKSRPIAPTMTEDGTILVDWYKTDDPDNPQNWSQWKKFWVAFLIDVYTFVVYSSSSIYISSTELVMERFGVGSFKASLGLALYVLGMTPPGNISDVQNTNTSKAMALAH